MSQRRYTVKTPTGSHTIYAASSIEARCVVSHRRGGRWHPEELGCKLADTQTEHHQGEENP